MSTIKATGIFNLSQLQSSIEDVKRAKLELREAETEYAKGAAVARAGSIIYGLIAPAAGTVVFLFSVAMDIASKYYDDLVSIVREIQWTMVDYEDLLQDNPEYDLVEYEITYDLVWDEKFEEKIAVPSEFKALKVHTTSGSGGWIFV